MTKIEYVSKNFRTSSMRLIDLSNTIIAEYRAQGFSLTLRQLYYRLVALGHIANKVQSYKRLGSIINDARLAGLVSWYAIEDRTRQMQGGGGYDSPSDLMSMIPGWFKVDRWTNQPWRLEVWVEKDALVSVVGRAANNLNVPYFSCRGYTSQSAMWRAGIRCGKHLAKQRMMIIHLADHDPSGIDMTRDIDNRFDVFWQERVKVNRIALNMDQIDQYQPPPNPAKVTDSRYEMYLARFGGDSWELDALEPQVIVDLIQDMILAHRDEELWQERLDEEAAMRELLQEATALVKEKDEWG